MANVILVLGLPGSGKTSFVLQKMKDLQNCERLNRDESGGKVVDLLPKMNKLLSDGKDVIIDNLFTTIEDREPFIKEAKLARVSIEAIHINASPEQCQFNACMRMAKKYGKVLNPEEIKDLKGSDPNTFPPAAFFRAKKIFDKPTKDEGFDKVTTIKKNDNHLSDEYKNKALILDYDGTLRETVNGNDKFPISVDQVCVDSSRGDVLRSYKEKGYLLLGASNQSGVSKGDLTYDDAVACFEKTNEGLGVDIDYLFDTSKVPPINSWNRKPMPGMGVTFIHKYKLDPSKCIMVGDMTSDKTFAQRCGFEFVHTDRFFK